MKMSEIEKVRVVPSGKIYRQMFEAQALLHRQLSRPKTQGHPRSQGLPLINTSRETSAQGILNSRQKNWLNGLPFDIYTENPVLYKQYSNFIHDKKQRSRSPAEKSLVQALPEAIVTKQLPTATGIVERLDGSRRVRHDEAVEELSHELNIIASELEGYVEEVTQTFYRQMEENEDEIEVIFESIHQDEEVLKFDYQGLDNLWCQVQDHLPKRLGYIKELNEKFDQVENLRSFQVRQLFVKYYQIFEKIAFRTQPELGRMMDNLAQMINQTLLSNRMNYTNIYFQLMVIDIERERKMYNYWASRIEFWKNIHMEQCLDKFREYLTSDEVMKPQIIEDLMEKMLLEHQGLNEQNMQLLNALRDLRPPKCLPKLLEQWFEQTQAVKKGMYETAGTYVLELERKHKQCTESNYAKLEEAKALLVSNFYCSEEMATLLTDEFIPWIDNVQMNFAQSMAELKQDLDKEFINTNDLITNLFIYLQSVAKLWRTHEAGLGQEELSLHESLQGHRGWHNEDNQKREDKLDAILDEMRQGANEGILNALLNQTKSLLTNIHISYQEFYTDQVKIVKTYPKMVAKQLATYEESICYFFSLKKVVETDRFKPRMEMSELMTPTGILSRRDSKYDESHKSPESKSRKSSVTISDPEAPSEQLRITSRISYHDRETKKETSRTPTLTDDYPEGHVDEKGNLKVEKDDDSSLSTSRSQSLYSRESKMDQASYLVTDAGTTYLILDKQEEKPIKDATESEEEKPKNVEHLRIPDNFFDDIRQQIRMNFLNHLDSWILDAKKNSDHATMAKIEELDAEFSLRTQLHIPRAKRIEQDVYNVRAGELLLHSSRVAEHCQGVEQALSDIKTKFLSIKDQQEKMMGEFHNEIELMEPAFLNITKSGRLLTLRNQMSKEIQKLMVNIRTSLRKYRVQLDQALQTVRESNASLVQNFKLFSDGGNFCPYEVSHFHETIEDLSKLIDENEGNILVEMEGMEATRFDQASRITIEFEDRFKNHIFDLLFMETVARWLTNTQVQIKTQVAKNNTSSKEVSSFISTLKKNIEICEVPNPDSTKMDPSEINEMFRASLKDVATRAKYLKCLKTNEEVITAEPTALVAFSSEIPAVSKPGKVMLDDHSVGMIKSILRSQKIEIIQESPETTTEDDEGAAENQENDNETSPTTKASKRTVRRANSRLNKRHIIINHSTKAIKLKLNFGEGEDIEEPDPEEETTDFLGLIKQLVQNIFVSIGAIAEDYYRQKGSRPITRPQVLQETYESCAEAVGDKLVSYYTQAKEYLLRCLTEFHCQLEELENLAKRIPPLLFRSLLQKHMDNLDEEFSQWENTFQNTFKQFELEQEHNSHLLQPNLGHPQKAAQLQKLNQDEMIRNEKFNLTIEEQFETLQKICVKCSESFLQEMVKLSEKLFVQFDELLVSSEVVAGKSDPFKIKTVTDPEPEKQKEETERKRRNKWPGVTFAEFYAKTPFKSPFKKKTSPTTYTNKNILPQQSTFQSRNDAYHIYVGSFERRIASVEKRKKELLHAEQKWMENWKSSVENIQQLFT